MRDYSVQILKFNEFNNKKDALKARIRNAYRCLTRKQYIVIYSSPSEQGFSADIDVSFVRIKSEGAGIILKDIGNQLIESNKAVDEVKGILKDINRGK